MSAGGAFGGSRGYQPRAPEKGVFPLDHFGECKQVRFRCFALHVGMYACRGAYADCIVRNSRNHAGVTGVPGLLERACRGCSKMQRVVQVVPAVSYG